MRADFALDYDVVSVARAQKLYLMARLEADETLEGNQRRPLNLSVVIDRSGSMAGDKIDYTRQAAQFLVQNLGMHDVLSVVLYNDFVEVLQPPITVRQKDHLIQKLGQIQAMGTTNLSGGWLEGCKLVAENFNVQYLNRVILMSDGRANRGVIDPAKLVNMVRQKYDEGISTTTMGLGDDFNEDLMMAMAKAGGGAFYFIESPEVAPLIFQEELQGLLNVVGQNLTISIQTTAQVSSIRQLNAYPAEESGNHATYRLGDIFSDEVKTLILELDIPAMQQLGEQQIATLRFEYDELLPDSSIHRVHELPVMINVQPDEALPPTVNSQMRQSVFLLKAAQARQAAVEAADAGDYEQAAALLESIAEELRDAAQEDEVLKDELKALETQIAKFRSGHFQDEHQRKLLKSQAFYTMTSRHEETVMIRNREWEREQAQQASDIQATIETENASQPMNAVNIERRPGIPPTQVTWRSQTFDLKGDLIRIGRSHHNEIIIQARGVSRFHCHIRREGEQLVLEDLGSTNGTWINGQPIHTPHTLSVGDEVWLSGEKLLFHDHPQQSQS